MRNICISLLLLHLIPGRLSALTLYGFTYHDEGMNWKDAQTFCRQRHADLITIRNEKENQALLNRKAWIGLYKDDTDGQWKWSRGDEIPTFLLLSSYVSSDPGSCARKSDQTEKWIKFDCLKHLPFYCSDDKLVLVKENKTWEEALEHCRSLEEPDSVNPVSGSGKNSYDLASLITDDDHVYARERAQQATTDEVWTGLRYLGNEWFWVGGEQVQYQDVPSCPAVRCGVLEKNSETSFGIRDCSQRRNFFCYKKPVSPSSP